MKRHISLAAAAMAALVSSSVYATPGFFVDLRVHGTGGKEATVGHLGDVVYLDLFATVTGADSNPSNDGLTCLSGAFQSSTGGLLGNLLGLTPPAPFDGRAGLGRQFDLDGDGDMDVGDLNPANDFNFYYPYATDFALNQPGGFYVGKAQFTITSLAQASADIQHDLQPHRNRPRD